MMNWANVTEKDLKRQGIIRTDFGEDLSWDYLCYVRDHPIKWDRPTAILYGSRDDLTTYDTIRSFAERHHADLTVMENGEHWFHTEEQIKFLDDWITTKYGTRVLPAGSVGTSPVGEVSTGHLHPLRRRVP